MDTTRLEQGARLEAVMKALGHNQPSFSAEIGVNQSNLSAAINGKRPVTRLVEKITKRYPFVNPAWIMWEHGEMLIEKKEEGGAMLAVVMEPDVGYERRAGEGRLEWLERKVEEAKTTQQDLLQMLAEAREQYIKLEEEHTALVQQLGEIKKRLSDLEGEK